MTTKELIRKLWIVCQHANNDNYKAINQRENVKVIKEVVERLKGK